MRAAQIQELTGAAGVELVDIDPPEPDTGEVLIEVRAVGISHADLLMAQGRYQHVPEVPFTLGMDVAGVVVAHGDGCSRWKVGDRVAATVPYGAAAEVLAAPEHVTFSLPEDLSFEEGAALPVNYLTAHFALVTRAGLQAGESVVIHGAAGGLGSAATQVARAWGARVIAVVSTEQKARAARLSGADEVVRTEGFKEAVMAATDGLGVDIVVDPVGARVFDDSLRCLRSGGRHLVLGFAGGEPPPMVEASRLLLRNIDVRGVSWGGHAGGDSDAWAAQWDAVVPRLLAGGLRPHVGGRYALQEVDRALTDMERRRTIGKVVLSVPGR